MKQQVALSTHKSCRLAGLSEASWYYRPKPQPENAAIVQRLRAHDEQRPAFGAPRIAVLIRREFGAVNHKRVERLYAEQGLQLPDAPTGPFSASYRRSTQLVQVSAARWTLCMTCLPMGCIRIFTLVDDYTRQCLALEVDTSIIGQCVTHVLSALRETGRLPQVLVCDNDTEFTSKAMLKSYSETGTKLHYIEPGKPTQNAYCESFNGKLRHECLRQHWFQKLEEARQTIEEWGMEYNHVRTLQQPWPADTDRVSAVGYIQRRLSLGVLRLIEVRSL